MIKLNHNNSYYTQSSYCGGGVIMKTRLLILVGCMLLLSSCERVTSNMLNVDYRGQDADIETTPAADGGKLAAQHQQREFATGAGAGKETNMMSAVAMEDGIPMAVLRNDKRIPLVGLGVGNLQHYLVPLLIASAEQDDKKTRLFDTAHSSDNEHLVAQGITQGMERYVMEPSRTNATTTGKPVADDEKLTLHVVTKVWYTHLGYERTKLSIRESFDQLKEAMNHPLIDLRVHIMLHWPRCYDNISFMNCEDDEENLPNHVKQAGPAPHLNRNNAWMDSWKALEDMYEEKEQDTYPIESIGLSNFNYHDLSQLDTFARIHPHILQVNVWSLLYDPHMVEYCENNGVHMQVYNVMSGIVTNPEKAPKAYHHLMKVSAELTAQVITENGEDTLSELGIEELSPAQAVLAWLIQHGVSVIPRTSRLSRLSENSAMTLSYIPELNDVQVETVAHAVEAYLSGIDMENDIHVSVTFHAPQNKDVMIFWNGHNGKQVHVAYIAPGETFEETTYPHHTYRLYDAQDIDVYVDYKVNAKLGEHENVHIEL